MAPELTEDTVVAAVRAGKARIQFVKGRWSVMATQPCPTCAGSGKVPQ